MIIIGYPGIGKSTLSKKRMDVIDLESGCFWDKPKNWEEYYIKLAEHLSKQGYIVFVSTHKEVQDELKKTAEKVFAIYPDLDLKDEWVKKLGNRYANSGEEKDLRAWVRARDNFEDDIKEIKMNCQRLFGLHNVDKYNLDLIVDLLREQEKQE